MTSEGSAYSRLQRPLLTGNLVLVEAAAAELPRIGLDDALTILALLADAGDPRFDRAPPPAGSAACSSRPRPAWATRATRWHSSSACPRAAMPCMGSPGGGDRRRRPARSERSGPGAVRSGRAGQPERVRAAAAEGTMRQR